MQKIFSNIIQTPVGFLEISTSDSFLISVKFKDIFQARDAYFPPILVDATKQIEEYFEGTRKEFDLNIRPEGTAFQQKIWELVKNIPYGQTASYLDIASQSGSKANTRAVGLANGSNPIPLIIPCHRIIGSNGKLTGYAGGLTNKRWLLLHEMNHTNYNSKLF